ncbi:hypothetical protein SAMN02787142_3056 [Burkholderia sp. WP9]|nr:hypothetical protein SAMN02787142_3056 [Burkholderia sp. WP9]
MKSSFSELSYAFALTENLVNSLGLPLLTAPAFPSTAAEGKKGAGHDLKLTMPGMNLFLQFKLSHCMRNASAKEFTSGKFLKSVGGKTQPVYRMYLHPLKSSRQTSLMLKLEKRHCFVYYVAPLFHLPVDLSKHFFAKTVAEESRFLRPSVIKKMPDKNEHFVSFRKTGKPWRFSNDPLELENAETVEQVKSRIQNELSQKMPAEERVNISFEHMLEALLEEANEQWPGARALRSEVARLRNLDMPSLEKASFVARNFFDMEMLTFGSQG